MPAPLPPHRVLIVRLSALGDLVFATSLLEGLKATHPDCEIDWLVQPEFSGFLRTQSRIRTVWEWPRKRWGALFKGLRWLALAREVIALGRQLRSQRYDWVLDVQGLAKSRALAWLAGGAHRVGYASKEPLGFVLHQQFARPEFEVPFATKSIASEHRALMRHLCGDAADYPPRLVRPSAAPASHPGIVLAPFTTRPQKHWPEAHWSALIDLLAGQGMALTLLGGPADVETAARILNAAQRGQAVSNLVGKTQIPQAATVIADADAVVGVDTGLTHMGIAFARPTVAIFGSTLPYRTGGLAPLEVLWLGMACSPCRRHPTCRGAFTCLADITPNVVRGALARVITQQKSVNV